MAAVITDERLFGNRPNKGLTGADNSSDTSHDTPMTKAEREELAELKELVHQQIALAALNAKTQPQIQVQAAPQITKWLLAVLTIFTFLGGAGSFVGQSGIFVGGKLERNERMMEDMNREREERERLQSRFDNLRTLYLIRFGEDPDKVTPETMNRRLKTSQEKK